MAAKKKKKQGLEEVCPLPVRSLGKRARWSQVIELLAKLNDMTKGDSEVAMDLVLATAHALNVTVGGDPDDLDQRYDEIRGVITGPAILMVPGGDA